MSKRLPLRVAGCATILTTLAGCTGASPTVGDFCLLYQPVLVADEDTAETIEQAMRNNAVW